jgi:hypothetical protein
MPDAQLDWAQATVKDGKLRVPLAGDVPKGWKGHFETTVKLLGHGRWGKVVYKKKVIHVGGAQDGEPSDLRFYLEGVVEQANSACAAERKTKAKGSSASSDEPSGPDAELTERFQAFAEAGERDDAEPGVEGTSDSG